MINKINHILYLNNTFIVENDALIIQKLLYNNYYYILSEYLYLKHYISYYYHFNKIEIKNE